MYGGYLFGYFFFYQCIYITISTSEMSKNWDSLSRTEKKQEAQKTLRMLDRKKKLKVWLNKLFNSNP